MNAASLTCGFYVFPGRAPVKGVHGANRACRRVKKNKKMMKKMNERLRPQVIMVLFMRAMSYTCVDEVEMQWEIHTASARKRLNHTTLSTPFTTALGCNAVQASICCDDVFTSSSVGFACQNTCKPQSPCVTPHITIGKSIASHLPSSNFKFRKSTQSSVSRMQRKHVCCEKSRLQGSPKLREPNKYPQP